MRYALPWLLALIIRCAMVANWTPVVLFDGPAYVELGHNIAEGKGFIFDSGEPNGFRAPGLPYLLSIVYSLVGFDLWNSAIFLIVLELLAYFLFVKLAHRIGGDSAAIRGSWLWGLQPFTTMYSLSHHSDVVALIPLLLLFFIYTQEHRNVSWYFIIGFFSGGLALLRPVMQVLPILLSAERLRPSVARLERKSVRISSIFAILIGYAVVVTPWMTHNYRTFGDFTICYQTGTNLYIGFHEGANGGYQYTNEDEQSVPPYAQMAARDQVLRQRAFDYIGHHPLGVVIVTAKKVVTSFTSHARGWVLYNTDLFQGNNWPPKQQPFWFFALLSAMSMGGCAYGWYLIRTVDRSSMFGFLFYAILGFTFLSMWVFFADSRFRLPVDLLFLLLIAIHGWKPVTTTIPRWLNLISYGGMILSIGSGGALLIKWWLV